MPGVFITCPCEKKLHYLFQDLNTKRTQVKNLSYPSALSSNEHYTHTENNMRFQMCTHKASEREKILLSKYKCSWWNVKHWKETEWMHAVTCGREVAGFIECDRKITRARYSALCSIFNIKAQFFSVLSQILLHRLPSTVHTSVHSTSTWV